MLNENTKVSDKFTLKMLKELCPKRNVIWYSVSPEKLIDIKKNIPHSNNIIDVQVSEYGEIRFEHTNTKYSYPATSESKFTEYPNLDFIYDIAANAFFGDKPKCQMGVPYSTHHITPNYCLNTPENLIYIKQCEHKYIHNNFLRCSEECKNCDIYINTFCNK